MSMFKSIKFPDPAQPKPAEGGAEVQAGISAGGRWGI